MPSCLSLPHTKLVGCPQPVPTPECSQSASPGLPDCKYDTPLTHVSLHASSHGSTQLAVCQVQSHPWAEARGSFLFIYFLFPRVIFYGPFVALGYSLGPLGLVASNCSLTHSGNEASCGASLLNDETFLFEISVGFISEVT